MYGEALSKKKEGKTENSAIGGIKKVKAVLWMQVRVRKKKT